LPNELETHDEKGDFLIKIKRGMIHEVVYATSFDVVGWDGYNNFSVWL
jgi:homogentisate 1,2-dioxygenase